MDRVSEGRLQELADQAWNGYVDDWTGDTHDEIASALRELQQLRRGWVSVKDRLPLAFECVPVLYKRSLHNFAYQDGGQWFDERGGISAVTHWYELPPPPEGTP